jgi:hypothetical protein
MDHNMKIEMLCYIIQHYYCFGEHIDQTYYVLHLFIGHFAF